MVFFAFIAFLSNQLKKPLQRCKYISEGSLNRAEGCLHILSRFLYISGEIEHISRRCLNRSRRCLDRRSRCTVFPEITCKN